MVAVENATEWMERECVCVQKERMLLQNVICIPIMAR